MKCIFKRFRNISAVFMLMVLSSVAITGCTAIGVKLGLIDPDAKVCYFVVSLHEIIPVGTERGRLTMPLPTAIQGERMMVGRRPLLSSQDFAGVASEVDGERGTLIAKLDQHGRYKWTQLVMNMNGQRVAVAVDGIFRFTWVVPAPATATSDNVRLEAAWTVQEAELISENAERNYRLLNRR